MKDYYAVLDVPITATPAEIKAQYRQMVRIYHPDRFRDQDDKAYAEEKLKEINIAFQVLSGTSVHREPFEARVAPQPIAYPPQLDFGVIAAGQKTTRKLQIGNIGGAAESINFVYSCEQPWFQVSKGQRVYEGQPFPLDFEVSVDTKRLQPGQQYLEWVEAVLDGIPVRVGLQLQVAERKARRLSPFHWVWTTAGVLVLLALLFVLPLFGGGTTFQLSESLISARPAYALHQNDMLFSVRENDVPMLYIGLETAGVPRSLGVVGQDAVASHSGQRIAYLDAVGTLSQISLFDLTSGDVTQITQSNSKKSMLSWSSDGLRLAYLVGSGKEQRIGVYDVRTGEESLLPSTLAAGVSHFAWSPNGQTLLFDLWQGTEQRVYRMGARGTDLQQLTDFDSWAGAWSADGETILIGTANGLYRLNNKGRDLQQITNVPATSFGWSADGAWIVYTTADDLATHSNVADAKAASQTLWLMEPDGKELRQITQDSVWYQWSSTGSVLGYVTGNLDSTEPLLYLWTLTPGKMPQLVAEVNAPFFSWPQ